MSAEKAPGLPRDQERPSCFFDDRLKTDQAPKGEPILFWDEIAKKWPRGRFPSFFSIDKSA